ncbi:MAG TPA: cysteine hydrolase family protein, partial [Nodosilinea sp.]|nr:cysteine hydrolase family protein [Nodosilinea sp.]
MPILPLPAEPYPYPLPATGLALIIIDMQRDFIEPGGFGDALGNDVGLLRSIIPNVKALQEAFRRCNLPIFQTVEGHLPDLSDCP